MDHTNYQYQQLEPLGTSNRQSNIRIYYPDKVETLQITEYILSLSFQCLKKQLINKLGFSSRIYLYQQPLCPSSKLQFLREDLTIAQIIKDRVICVTFNNTKFSEESQYERIPIYSKPPSAQSIEAILQICQNNFLFHQNYRIDSSGRIGFLHSLSARLGPNVYLQYYNTRMHLQQFPQNSTIFNVLSRFTDHTSRLTIAIDSTNFNPPLNEIEKLQSSFQKIGDFDKIKQNLFFTLKVRYESYSKSFAVSRKCKIKPIKFMLNIIFNRQVSLYFQKYHESPLEQHIPSTQHFMYAVINKQEESIVSLSYPLKKVMFVGQRVNISQNSVTLFLIQSSYILHKILVTPDKAKACLACPIKLSCPSSLNLDEQLFVLHEDFLIGYSITIQFIKLKYYSFQGKLAMVKIFPWYTQQYDIQFHVIDLFYVKLTKSLDKARVFYIYDPQNYLQVPMSSKFYPAKFGYNNYSDGSGVFAIGEDWTYTLSVYSLRDKSKISQIKTEKYKQINKVLFSQHEKDHMENRKIVIGFNNGQVSIFNIKNGQNIENFSNIHSELLFLNNLLYLAAGNQLSLIEEEKKDKRDLKYIPQKCLVIQRNGKALIRQKVMEIDTLSKVYTTQQL